MKKVILYSVFILFSAVQGLFGVTYFDDQWEYIEANKRNWGKRNYGLICKDFVKTFEDTLRGFNDTVSKENIDELVAMVGEIVTKVYSNRGNEVYKQLPGKLAERSIEKVTNYINPSYEQSINPAERSMAINQELDLTQQYFCRISFIFLLFDRFLDDPTKHDWEEMSEYAFFPYLDLDNVNGLIYKFFTEMCFCSVISPTRFIHYFDEFKKDFSEGKRGTYSAPGVDQSINDRVQDKVPHKRKSSSKAIFYVAAGSGALAFVTYKAAHYGYAEKWMECLLHKNKRKQVIYGCTIVASAALPLFYYVLSSR